MTGAPQWGWTSSRWMECIGHPPHKRYHGICRQHAFMPIENGQALQNQCLWSHTVFSFILKWLLKQSKDDWLTFNIMSSSSAGQLKKHNGHIWPPNRSLPTPVPNYVLLFGAEKESVLQNDGEEFCLPLLKLLQRWCDGVVEARRRRQDPGFSQVAVVGKRNFILNNKQKPN